MARLEIELPRPPEAELAYTKVSQAEMDREAARTLERYEREGRKMDGTPKSGNVNGVKPYSELMKENAMLHVELANLKRRAADQGDKQVKIDALRLEVSSKDDEIKMLKGKLMDAQAQFYTPSYAEDMRLTLQMVQSLCRGIDRVMGITQPAVEEPTEPTEPTKEELAAIEQEEEARAKAPAPDKPTERVHGKMRSVVLEKGINAHGFKSIKAAADFLNVYPQRVKNAITNGTELKGYIVRWGE